ncbi:MAG: S8 family serine peptidase, partial [Rudaea sp.]|nr:S8 family serine peptidase [Rudaea sp.]
MASALALTFVSGALSAMSFAAMPALDAGRMISASFAAQTDDPTQPPGGFVKEDGPARQGRGGPRYTPEDANGRARYIVILTEAPVATYKGETQGYAAIPKRASSVSGTVRKDIDSAQAKSYASHLQSQQRSFTASLTSKLGRAITPAAQFQYALNAVALDLTADEAEALRQDSNVHLVNREQIREPKTFDTPRLINATGVWNGTDTLGGVTSKGEGMVVGIIDTGINWMSHSFLATGSDGYTVVNPLGDGNYLGGCKTGGADVGHCNSKLIGIYNFVALTTPPGTSTSGQDLDGHGSHTSSTAAGNSYTTAPFAGGTFNVSGIAPHANVIMYAGCCSDTGLTSSLNQAIIDKVDTLNFSIGGTGGDSLSSPWTDTGELAFLSLQDAGVFVAAAAGNDGPSDNSFDHASPWVTTVGATTPAMIAAFSFSLSGGPANTQNLAAISGAAPLPTQAYLNLPLIESPNFADGSNDGCAAYPANYFRRGQTAAGAQGIAVLRLDQNASNCGSGARRTNAANAGAIAVVYVDPEFINLGATGASYSLLKEGWDAIKASGADVTPTGTATATIGFPVSPTSRPADRMAGFSSRGPSPFATLKPDISAPGDTILAAMSPTAASGYTTANQAATSDIYKNDSGTSMATPHITGAATLVRALHRDWTPMQVKSALMTTANKTVYNETGSALTTPNTVGAGRVNVGAATRAGLLFDETHANFIAANPANGGKPETLNIASLYHFGCTATCVFPRTVSSALNVSGNWTITVNGLAAGSYSLDKTSFSLANKGDTSSFTLSVDSTKLGAAPGAWVYGELLLTPNAPNVSVQRLPIAILPTAARLTADVNSFAVKVSAGKTTTKPITISNTGNPTLNWSFSTTSLDGTILFRSPSNSGYSVVTIASGTAITSTSNTNRYIGDYFDLSAPARVSRLQANAFTNSSSGLAGLASQVAWRIYADSGSNTPAGRPGITTPAEQPAFVFNSAANTATATKTRFDGQVSVDLVAAGASPPTHPTGRYWMMMTPTIASATYSASSSNRWFWFSNDASPKAVPGQSVTGNGATRAYTSLSANTGMAMRVDINATCSAPWLGYGSNSGALGAGASSGPVAVSFDATSLSAGVYKAYVCLSGNGTSPSSFVDSINTDSILIPTTLRVSSCTATPNPTDSTATVTITCLGVEPGTTNTIPGATCSAVTADPSGGKIVCTGTAGNIGNDPTWTSTNTATNDTFTSVVPLTFPIYTVTTTTSGAGGTISAPAQSPLVPGGSTTFTVSALTGYSIASVTGDTCSPSVQSGSTYTTGPVTANCTITASFTANAVNGACGTDNGQTLTVAPTNLCSAGTASVVTGN